MCGVVLGNCEFERECRVAVLRWREVTVVTRSWSYEGGWLCGCDHFECEGVSRRILRVVDVLVLL